MKETDSLFIQISELVDKRIAKHIGGSKNSTLQAITGVAVGSDRNFNQVVNELSKLFITQSEFTSMDGRIDDLALALENMVDEIISEGLEVSAQDPPSINVNISAGYGGKRGRPCRLDTDKTVKVPLDEFSSIFYITLRSYGQVNVRRSKVDDELTLAKIVVPKPGITSTIIDNQDDSYDAYIVSAKDSYFDGNTVFDEDSKAVLRNAIGDILADNLIGNIRLSENLKIINTQGTLELDSKELLIKDTASNVLSRFDKDGIYIFDAEGFERARFTGDEARVGNIIVKPESLESQNFASGALGSGFKIEDTGHAEFQDVFIRGKITSTIFEKESVSAIGGNLVVLDGDLLDEDMDANDETEISFLLEDGNKILTEDGYFLLLNFGSVIFTLGDATFEVGDTLRIKDSFDDEWFEVICTEDAPEYNVIRDKNNDYAVDSNPAWKKGTTIVNYDQPNTGGIFMTASENNSPYISVFKHNGFPWSTTDTLMRFGNLNGFLGYNSDLYGIAIGETERYLKYDPTNGLRIKGDITITGGNASVTFYQDEEPIGQNEKDGDYWVDTNDDNALYVYNSGWQEVSSGSTIVDDNGMLIVPPTPVGAGLYLGSTYLGYYSGSEWQSYIADNGNFLFKGDNDNYVQWDGANLNVRGTLNADDITAGTLTGITIQGNTIQTASLGSRVVMNSNNLVAYDDDTNTVLNVILSGGDVGDVIIGEYGSSKGLKWDKSASTFNIKGAITASSGDFTGTVNVGTAGKVYIDGANEVIKVYDASSNLMVELGKLS